MYTISDEIPVSICVWMKPSRIAPRVSSVAIIGAPPEINSVRRPSRSISMIENTVAITFVNPIKAAAFRLARVPDQCSTSLMIAGAKKITLFIPLNCCPAHNAEPMMSLRRADLSPSRVRSDGFSDSLLGVDVTGSSSNGEGSSNTELVLALLGTEAETELFSEVGADKGTADAEEEEDEVAVSSMSRSNVLIGVGS